MLQFQLRIGQLTKCVSSSLPESFDLRTVVGLVGLELVTAKKSQETTANTRWLLVTGCVNRCVAVCASQQWTRSGQVVFYNDNKPTYFSSSPHFFVLDIYGSKILAPIDGCFFVL